MLKPAVNGFSGGEMNVEILPGQGSHLHKARILGKCVVTGDLYAVECDALVLLDYMLQLAEDKAPLRDGNGCIDDQLAPEGQAW
mgnify:CR=1 FL=1